MSDPIIRIEPPRVPPQGTMVLPDHKRLASQRVLFDPFYPCHLDAGITYLVSKGVFADADIECWEHPCPECQTIYRFTRERHYWTWEPIKSYTVGGGQSWAEPIDYVLVMERKAREQAAA